MYENVKKGRRLYELYEVGYEHKIELGNILEIYKHFVGSMQFQFPGQRQEITVGLVSGREAG